MKYLITILLKKLIMSNSENVKQAAKHVYEKMISMNSGVLKEKLRKRDLGAIGRVVKIERIKKMTPAQIAKSGTEHAHQSAFFAYCNIARYCGFEIADYFCETGQLPTNKETSNGIECLKWIHAIPNGGIRGDDSKSRKIRGAQLKAEGVKPGVADIFFPYPCYVYHGLYIEMKKPAEKPVNSTSKGGLSDKQIEFASDMKKLMYSCVVCYSWQEAVNALKQYYVSDLMFDEEETLVLRNGLRNV